MNPVFLHILDIVRRLGPGQRVNFSREILYEGSRQGLEHFMSPSGQTTADLVLENIVGSAYEYGYFEPPDLPGRDITFYRLERPLKDGRRTYVSPDRREHFHFDGLFYIPKHEHPTPPLRPPV